MGAPRHVPFPLLLSLLFVFWIAERSVCIKRYFFTLGREIGVNSKSLSITSVCNVYFKIVLVYFSKYRVEELLTKAELHIGELCSWRVNWAWAELTACVQTVCSGYAPEQLHMHPMVTFGFQASQNSEKLAKNPKFSKTFPARKHVLGHDA